jgi:hypothetical protein
MYGKPWDFTGKINSVATQAYQVFPKMSCGDKVFSDSKPASANLDEHSVELPKRIISNGCAHASAKDLIDSPNF